MNNNTRQRAPKLIIASALAVMIGMALAACSNPPTTLVDADADSWEYIEVTGSQGQRVPCVHFKLTVGDETQTYTQCDWDGVDTEGGTVK